MKLVISGMPPFVPCLEGTVAGSCDLDVVDILNAVILCCYSQSTAD